jgi:photosystem II stability/assembly factor-like uncharacterized protein
MAELRWRPMRVTSQRARRFDDVFFIDPQTGWTVNSNGLIAKTTDGGASWTPQHRAGAYMRCIGFADANHGWAGTTSTTQRMFATQNGGETWAPVTNLPANAPVKICGLSIVDRTTVYASGTNEPVDQPRMMKTTNGGETWTAWEMREWASILIDNYFIDAERGWVVGGKTDDPEPESRDEIKPVVLFTEDGGRTWVDRLAGQEAEFPFGEWGWKIQFLNERLGFVSLENFTDAAILKTTDGGLTWKRIKVEDPQNNANLEGIGFIDEQRGWVGGWGDPDFQTGHSSGTDDGGTTWRDADEIGRFINRFRFLGNPVTVGYASGVTVFKYSDEPIVAPQAAALQAEPALLPEAELRMREWPVSIPASIPAGTTRITLDIWDRFGKHMGTILDERRPRAGDRTLVWDGYDTSGRRVPPGFFIARLTADDDAASTILVIDTPRRASR